MRISDWSSDVCSSDLVGIGAGDHAATQLQHLLDGVDRNVARARDDHLLAVEIQPARAQHPLHEIDGAVAGCLRPAERRVAKECVTTCTSRWPPHPHKTNTPTTSTTPPPPPPPP